MKKLTLGSMTLLWTLLLILGHSEAQAQDTIQKNQEALIPVKKRTVLGQYEPNLVISVEERIRLKKQRNNLLNWRKSVIDTMDISERKKRKLLRELSDSPFSDRLARTFADIQFTDEE